MQFLLLKNGGFLDTYLCLGCKVSIDKIVGSPYLLVPLFIRQQKGLDCYSIRAMKDEVNLKN